MNLGMNKWI